MYVFFDIVKLEFYWFEMLIYWLTGWLMSTGVYILAVDKETQTLLNLIYMHETVFVFATILKHVRAPGNKKVTSLVLRFSNQSFRWCGAKCFISCVPEGQQLK